MFQNLAHEVFIDLGCCYEPVHAGRVVQFFDGGDDVFIARWRLKAMSQKQVFSIDHHLCPSIDGNCGIPPAKTCHFQGTVSEGFFPKFVNHIGRRFTIQYSCLRPWKDILQGMVNHIRQIACCIGGSRPGAEFLFFNRDYLDTDSGFRLKCFCHGFLLGHSGRLVFCRPKPQICGHCRRCE